MSDLFANLQAWHWLSAGIFFLLLEILGTAGFLLGVGLGALCVALFLAVLPGLSWQWQFTIFAVMSVVCTVGYWRYFRNFNQTTDQPMLNNRVASLIGQRAVVVQAITAGRGKVQIQDTLWTVTADEDIAEGCSVKIVGAEGMELKVSLISQ